MWVLCIFVWGLSASGRIINWIRVDSHLGIGVGLEHNRERKGKEEKVENDNPVAPVPNPSQ